MYSRTLNLDFKKSLFLFGPRQTGKSTLLKSRFPNAYYIDLLLNQEVIDYQTRPGLLAERLTNHDQTQPVIIDEIQRVPELLNDIHHLIESTNLRFILTGSSARKLKRGAANMLGGRAYRFNLYPLTFGELNDDFDLLRALNYGLLPAVYLSTHPQMDLKAYASTYLREEVFEESLVRKLRIFSDFLNQAGHISGQLINFHSIASDLGVSSPTIKEYFSILEDTLIAHLIPPFKTAGKRKSVSKYKFYFFDIGVANHLAKRGEIQFGSPDFGLCFEHYILQELIAHLSYHHDDRTLSFWRSTQGDEVDFMIGSDIAIEVKGKSHVKDKDLKGLRRLNEVVSINKRYVVSLEQHHRVTEDGIEILSWKDFISRLSEYMK